MFLNTAPISNMKNSVDIIFKKYDYDFLKKFVNVFIGSSEQINTASCNSAEENEIQFRELAKIMERLDSSLASLLYFLFTYNQSLDCILIELVIKKGFSITELSNQISMINTILLKTNYLLKEEAKAKSLYIEFDDYKVKIKNPDGTKHPHGESYPFLRLRNRLLIDTEKVDELFSYADIQDIDVFDEYYDILVSTGNYKQFVYFEKLFYSNLFQIDINLSNEEFSKTYQTIYERLCITSPLLKIAYSYGIDVDNLDEYEYDLIQLILFKVNKNCFNDQINTEKIINESNDDYLSCFEYMIKNQDIQHIQIGKEDNSCETDLMNLITLCSTIKLNNQLNGYEKGLELESKVKELAESLNCFHVVSKGGAGDCGEDLILIHKKTNKRIVVQCKNHVKAITWKEVQDIVSKMQSHFDENYLIVANKFGTKVVLNAFQKYGGKLYLAEIGQ